MLDTINILIRHVVAQTKTTEEFIRDAIKVHGNKYNYDQVEYKNNATKIRVYCNKCEEYFYQKPNDHLNGHGCQICGKNKINVQEYIKKATKVHGNKYSYHLIKEIPNKKAKLRIYCNTCKKVFEQRQDNHLYGRGCYNCSNRKAAKKRVLTNEQFIERATKVHGNKYNYNQIEYKDNDTKVKIICNKCGNIFEQTPHSHLQRNGCKKCSPRAKLTNEQFIERAIKIHGNKFDYNKINYKNSSTKIEIYCKQCKQYIWQLPTNHLNGYGCINCNGVKRSNTKEFIQKAIEIHNNKYNYDQVKYIGNKNQVEIICNKCGNKFSQKPEKHLSGQGCPICTKSKPQEELYKFITEITNADYNTRKIISPYELDVYIPENKLAIEIHGLHWHSEQLVGKYYHLNKYKMCKEKGITLIQIFENEWYNKSEQIKSYIKTKLGLNTTITTYIIKEISKQQYNQFQNQNTIIKHKPGDKNIAITNNNEVYAVATFKDNNIIQYIEKINYTVQNGIEAILNQNNYITNNRYPVTGNYKTIQETEPEYYYTKLRKLYQKFYYPIKKFKNHNNDLTAKENMANNGYEIIWDAGYTILTTSNL